jgi:hypothetical protein
MTGSEADRASTKRSGPKVAGETPTIRLSLNGDELMVSGRFDHWAPVALEGDAGQIGAAQIFFDVTGMAGPRLRDVDDELFSYTSHSVQRIGALAYAAKGTMKRGDVEQKVDAVVQAPAAHTPFVVITFSIPRDSFPEVWEQLSTIVAGQQDGAINMAPRAWLRPPTLAAA